MFSMHMWDDWISELIRMGKLNFRTHNQELKRSFKKAKFILENLDPMTF
jgi:hypothetical protein